MADQEDARVRIVDAAERLFAGGDEQRTSLRAITREAGVNVAAVHYHFGGRDGLLREVLDRQIGPLNERRFELLDAVEARGEVSVEGLLEAFLRPDLELLARLRVERVQVARFLGRAYTQPGPVVARLVQDQFRPLAARLVPLLESVVPGAGHAELLTRLHLVVSVVTGLFATAVPPGQPHLLGSDDIEQQLRLLLGFFTPALSAPPTT